jgi:hypothetical protein
MRFWFGRRAGETRAERRRHVRERRRAESDRRIARAERYATREARADEEDQDFITRYGDPSQ